MVILFTHIGEHDLELVMEPLPNRRLFLGCGEDEDFWRRHPFAARSASLSRNS